MLAVQQLLQDMSEEEITKKKIRDVVGETLDPTIATFLLHHPSVPNLDYFRSET